MTSDAAPTSGPEPHAGTSPPATTPPADHTPPSGQKPATTEPTTGKRPATQAPRKTSLKTRTGYTWVALVAAAVLGIVLLIFVIQNLDQAEVHLFFWTFSLPLGITILLSVIAGALVMALVGGWRILQLRRAAKRG
ncbi:putative integral membrane protein [Nocardia transvalensis]|uniref:Putative integral membrane protein n=1 Tax=Nocardia transvalensis TaxID=37333 RepID=A0A7W9UFX1_9NOCA|nr:lipopolysaccharide assembly protein LapA domain-containing protein [Nocardia transvalensis]MBB5911567.1 putative integral membrane protein [Nocardia transvalensis]